MLQIKVFGALVILLLAGLNLHTCSTANTLREKVGEERQKCETEFAEYRANRIEALSNARSEARREADIQVFALREQVRDMELRNAELSGSLVETESQLNRAMQRIEQEDSAWGSDLVPRYLLPSD